MDVFETDVDVSAVDMVFLPMHLHGSHLGLLVFDARKCSVEHDDGFRYTMYSHISSGKASTTLKAICETTGLLRFQASIWSRVQRFRAPMPDQPSGSASCRVFFV